MDKHKTLPSILYIIWPMHLQSLSCYVQRFRGKYIYKKYLIWPWPRSRAHEALPSTSCDLCTCKVWSCYGKWLRDALLWKYIIWPWPQGQGYTKCCSVPSTLCDLCTCKMWCCYIPWFRNRCTYKKIHYLTLTLVSRSHKMLLVPSTSCDL